MNNNEQTDFTPFQRQQRMLEYINRQGSASVKQLAETFFLHEATVRRDLNALGRAGQITRVHGGAAAMEGLQGEIPLYVRETAFREIKRELARKAAGMVKDGKTIFIDSSSTAALMTPFLENKKNLRIVTDGAQTSLQLSRLKDAQVFCVGGCLGGNSLSYITNDDPRSRAYRFLLDYTDGTLHQWNMILDEFGLPHIPYQRNQKIAE